jgi:hypothetical protein
MIMMSSRSFRVVFAAYAVCVGSVGLADAQETSSAGPVPSRLVEHVRRIAASQPDAAAWRSLAEVLAATTLEGTGEGDAARVAAALADSMLAQESRTRAWQTFTPASVRRDRSNVVQELPTSTPSDGGEPPRRSVWRSGLYWTGILAALGVGWVLGGAGPRRGPFGLAHGGGSGRRRRGRSWSFFARADRRRLPCHDATRLLARLRALRTT